MKKWLMTKGAIAKLSVALAGLLVVAAIGTGIYLGVKPSDLPEDQTVVAIDDQQAPTADAPETTEEDKKDEETTETVVEIPDVVEEVTEDARVKEGYDLVNGNFADGLFAYEMYAMNAGDIYYDTNDSGLTVRIMDTGTEDWHVQLKQSDIRLEQGRWYRLSLDAKSDIQRDITYTLMHDGLNDNNWTLYAPQKKITLGNSWQRYSVIFCMNELTDNHAVFNVSMGTIDGRRITTNHAVSLNNIRLEALPANFIDSMRSGDNLISNPYFEYEDITWDANVVAPGQASTSFTGGQAVFNISNPGTLDWHVQLKQGGISLEEKTGYRVSFNVSSSVARTIKLGIMDTSYVTWYGGDDITVGPGTTTVTVKVFNNYAANPNALLMISMGKIEGVDTPASTITMSNFYMGKDSSVTAASASGGGNYNAGPNPTTNLGNGWEVYDHECAHTAGSFVQADGSFKINVTNIGTEAWHAQLTKKTFDLEKGKTYKIGFEGRSTIARNITYMMQHNGNADNIWDTYTSENSAALTTEWNRFEQTFTMPKDDKGAVYNFSMGYVDDSTPTAAHSIELRNITFEEVVKQPIATVTGNDEHKAEFVINPADYGVENPVGKVLKIKVTLRSTAVFEGAIGGNTPAGWSQSEGFKSEDGKEQTWEHVLDSYVDFVKADIWYMGADTLDIMDVTVEEVRNPIAVIYPNDENKSEYVINPADFGIEDPAGKVLKIKVALRSDAMFKGAIGGNTPSGWSQSKGYESADGREQTWEYVLDSYVDFVKADIWYMSGSSVEIMDVQVTEADPSEEPSEPSEPAGNSIVIKANQGEYAINPADYGIENPVGKVLDIKVTLKADAYFKGSVGGNTPEGWRDCGEQISEDGSEQTWEWKYEYVDYVKADIWWTTADSVEIVNIEITVEDNTEGNEGSETEIPGEPETPETPEEPVPSYVAVINAETPKNEGGNPEIELSVDQALVGKKVLATVELESSDNFNGMLGGCNTESWTWTQTGTLESQDNRATWTYEFYDMKGAFKLQIFWMGAGYVNVTNVTFTEVTDEIPSEPIVVNAEDHTFEVGAAKTADGNLEMCIGTDEHPELVGKKVKFSADLQSDSYYGGKIIIQSHEDYSGWNASEEYNIGATGEVSHWEVIADDYKQAFIQIYWRDEEYNPSDIIITNITLEVVEDEE